MEEEIIDNVESRIKDILREKTAYCFAGGGVLGVSLVGAIEELIAQGGFVKHEYLIGSSIGSVNAAVAAACVAAKMTPAEIAAFLKKTVNIDFSQFEENDTGIIRDLIRLIRKFGWNKRKKLEKWYETLMEELVGNPKITMLELYELSGVDLTLVYYSNNYKKTKHADHITKPDWTVAFAMAASSAIPLFYKAVWLKRKGLTDEVLSDGGTMDNYPLHVLRSKGVDPRKILGFRFFGTYEINEYKAEKDDDEIDYGPPANIKEFILNLIAQMRVLAMKVHVSKKDWMLTVKINTANFGSTDFDMTEKEKEWLYNSGKQSIHDYMKEISGPVGAGEYPMGLFDAFVLLLEKSEMTFTPEQQLSLFKLLSPLFA